MLLRQWFQRVMMGVKDFYCNHGRVAPLQSSCLACVKPLAWPLAYKTNETAKQNKQQNKAEPLLLGDTLTHSMGNAGVGRRILQLVNRMQHTQACAADALDKNNKLTTI